MFIRLPKIFPGDGVQVETASGLLCSRKNLQPIALLLEMESWKSLHPLHLVCQFARCRYMLYPIGFLKKKDSCRVIRKTPPAAQVVEFEG